ncbi:hypothetical protein [Qipengyuania sp.]|uniref:hypothetical protein n=1 Tax=Qipengyuania sp. TaxID=2004515 RepID=UPI0035C8438B
MSEDQPPKPVRQAAPQPSREDRLAAKLRENLRRRKLQARELAGAGSDGNEAALPKGEPGR